MLASAPIGTLPSPTTPRLKPAYKHLAYRPGVDVQTAQDTASAIKSITQDEVCYANALGKHIHVTIETFYVVTYLWLNPCTPSSIRARRP